MSKKNEVEENDIENQIQIKNKVENPKEEKKTMAIIFAVSFYFFVSILMVNPFLLLLQKQIYSHSFLFFFFAYFFLPS